jgi:hypothetical protein
VSDVTRGQGEHAVDLYWLPLGAGAGAGSGLVRFNGRVYEFLHATVHRRRPADLYHAALEVHAPGGRFVIELTPAAPGDRVGDGVVRQGPVGSRWLGRFRVFRYELHCWLDGVIPDVDQAVGRPQRLTRDPQRVERLLAAVGRAPTLVWGRDERHAGEMWNSNSVIAWLLVQAGVPAAMIEPPPNGRAPGWRAGLVVARRDQRITSDVPAC